MEVSLVTFCIENVPRKSNFSVTYSTFAKFFDIQSTVGALLYVRVDISYVLTIYCWALASQDALMVKNLPANAEDTREFLGWENPLEEGMATHSSILAWRIPWTEETDRLQFFGSERIGHNWSNLACIHTLGEHLHVQISVLVAQYNPNISYTSLMFSFLQLQYFLLFLPHHYHFKQQAFCWILPLQDFCLLSTHITLSFSFSLCLCSFLPHPPPHPLLLSLSPVSAVFSF